MRRQTAETRIEHSPHPGCKEPHGRYVARKLTMRSSRSLISFSSSSPPSLSGRDCSIGAITDHNRLYFVSEQNVSRVSCLSVHFRVHALARLSSRALARRYRPIRRERIARKGPTTREQSGPSSASSLGSSSALSPPRNRA